MIERFGLVGLALAMAAPAALAQSRILTMPGYENWAKVSPQISGSVKLGSINASWAEIRNPSTIRLTASGGVSISRR